MQRVDGFYLYSVGWQVHPLLNLKWDATKYGDAYYPLLTAQSALSGLLYQSVFQVSTCQVSGQNLMSSLGELLSGMGHSPKDWEELIPSPTLWGLQELTRSFEAVLQAEFGLKPLYFVSPKANLDVNGLIQAGHLCFPPELVRKVPEALLDAQEATKCIAYELPTAAGFHLHRANESVLRRYFDQVAGEDKRPETRNMGDYLNKMRDMKVGD